MVSVLQVSQRVAGFFHRHNDGIAGCFSFVEGHCEVAVLAIFNCFAGGALNEGMKAPAVEKKHDLPVLAKCPLHTF